VSIPVALFPATAPKDVRFHLFDRQGRRVRYRRITEDDAGAPIDDPGEADAGTAPSPGRDDEDGATPSTTGEPRSEPAPPTDEPETR
jgi:hypothetical protein